jgi:hypothetical protein
MAQVPIKELMKNPTVKSTAIGIGVAVLVPVAVTYLAPLMRPVARSTLKAGLVTVEKGREMIAELGEIFEDLVAEVREEMRAERTLQDEGRDEIAQGVADDQGDPPPYRTTT